MNSIQIVPQFFSGLAPRTVEAYRADLRAFARFLGCRTIDVAAKRLLSNGPGEANRLVLEYRASLDDKSPATINRRLAAIRSLVRLARLIGVVTWKLDVRGVRTTPYRDTRGPGVNGYRKLLDALSQRRDSKGARDRAIVRLLYDVALRRGEVVSLDFEHVCEDKILVLGKGQRQRQAITLPAPTRKTLTAWIKARGTDPGPLFTNFDRAGKGKRLTGRSIHKLLGKLGVRPHGLRHAAITSALDKTAGDVRKVQRFSRHADVRTLLRYDDAKQDFAAEVSRLVAEV